jgi:ubiquinone/menaquinone biosynthesis C-methylase UbiE
MVDHKNELNSAERALAKISARKILDVATGSGGFITFMLDNIMGFDEITGIDRDGKPLQAARKAFPQGTIRFQQMDAAQLDFPDDHFDMVCLSNSLHHMENLPGTLAEMKRVCKPGGYFIISEMYRDDQSETQKTHVALHHWWAAVDTANGIVHHETYTRQEIVDLVGKIGLQSVGYYDLIDIKANPKDPELVADLDGIIDHYIQRAQAKQSQVELVQRGEQLRRMVHEVGFHGATTLFVLGRN